MMPDLGYPDQWGAKAQEEAPSPTRPGGARDVGGSNGSAAPGGSAGGSKTITVDGARAARFTL